jgi:hypothetical protein
MDCWPDPPVNNPARRAIDNTGNSRLPQPAKAGRHGVAMNLGIACGDYDRTRRLFDGTVGIGSHRLTLSTFPPEEMFQRAFESAEFDISELP